MSTVNRKASSLSIACAVATLAAVTLACNLLTPKPADDFVCQKGITPGQTKKADVLSLLGNPARTEQDGANEILLFLSPYPKQFDTIILQDQTVVFMDVILGEEDALAYSAIKALYGEPKHSTYSTYLQGSLNYIYPDKGRAFIADENADIVFTKQCFISMSLEDYLNTWGKNLPTENPFIR
jgi:hypothetical protein